LDRIKVRRPFDPSLFEAAPTIELPPPEEEQTKDEPDEEERRPTQEEVQEEISEVHPEHEEKPVAEGGQQTSEDYHGGTELTFSMPVQRQSAQQQGSGGERAEEEGEQSEEEAEEEAGGGTAQEEGAEEPQEGVEGEGAEEEGREEPAGGEEGEAEQEGSQSQELKEVEGSGGAEEGPEGAEAGEEEEQAGSREAEQRVESGEEEEEGGEAEGGEEEHGGEGEGEESEEGGAEGEEEGSWEEEEGGEDEGEEEEGSDRQSVPGGYNADQVVELEGEEGGLPPEELRRLQTEFYRLIEMIAEEKTKQFDPSLAGSLVKAEYDVKRMALRRFEGKPPTYYKMPRVRESVVLILDNSGSMAPYANMLRALADVAARRRDVEIYIAPNGHVEEELAPAERPVNHDEFMRKTAGRKIIYVGDFDGANTPIELSWKNDVIWIAPEARYRRFLSHNWVRYGEDKYRGTFIRAFDVDDILDGIKKALTGAKWIDMCDVCADEEEEQDEEERW